MHFFILHATGASFCQISTDKLAYNINIVISHLEGELLAFNWNLLLVVFPRREKTLPIQFYTFANVSLISGETNWCRQSLKENVINDGCSLVGTEAAGWIEIMKMFSVSCLRNNELLVISPFFFLCFRLPATVEWRTSSTLREKVCQILPFLFTLPSRLLRHSKVCATLWKQLANFLLRWYICYDRNDYD